MNKLCEIFNSIYFHSNNAVVIFAASGDIIWKNRNADNFFKGEIKENTVFSEIISHVDDHGTLSCYFGGIFNKAHVLETDCYIAELYVFNHIFDLFADKRIYDFIVNDNAGFRRELSAIVSSCDEIGDAVEENRFDDIKECTKITMKACLNMSRRSIINTILSSSNQFGIENESLICIKSYIEELAAECRQVLEESLDEKCTVLVGDLYGGSINANKNALNCFMLDLIKRLITNVRSKSYKLVFSAVKKAEFIKVSITVSSDDPEDKIMFSKSSLGLDDDILKLLAQVVDAKYSLYGGSVNILFNLSKNNGESSMKSDSITLGGGMFSIYNVMLNGK